MEWRQTVKNMVGIVDAIYIGEWNVGNVQPNPCYMQPHDNKFTAFCYLPGVPTQLGVHDKQTDAEAELVAVVKEWITKSGLGS
ncbi:hypothetical protein Q6670_004110 [Salmonella enterica]|nr:hypothetical protein [Salmonella enterica]